jgi:alpha-beta hydrolase superfamily lysophospholipase
MNQPVSRRKMVASAAFAATAPRLLAATSSAPKLWSNEYFAKKGEVSLYLLRKRSTPPKSGETPRPALFLVHGSSISSRNSFDVTVPGRGEYSVMNTFAALGYDVWTMDHENYGRSSQTSSNSDIASGVEDLKAGIDLVTKETGQQKVHMFGESSGGLRAGAFAMARPERVDRLILAAFTYKGDNSPTLAERAKQLDYYKTHNRRLRDREMIRSIATRDKPGTSDQAVMDYVADQELKFGDQVPTGTYLDMTAHLPLVDPARVKSPVLLVRGEYDGIATVDDLQEFFKHLPNGDRQFVILPGMAHSVVTGLNRQLFWHAMHSFLAMPKGSVT